jgi:DNA-binding NarL/FixJ family response regulator
VGVVDELVQARIDYERGEWVAALDTWSGLDPDALGVEDLRGAALSAYLLGRPTDAVGYHQRAFRLCEDAGDRSGAVRCAFHLAMILATTGEEALAGGWTARAERLADAMTGEPAGETGGDVVERGYVAFLHMYRYIDSGDWPAAAECAAQTVAAGRAHADADLLALGLCASGRITIYRGRVLEGVALLDEAMAGATAGEVSPEVFGNVYCTAIEGCQEIADFARVAAWTAALHRWCASMPGLVTFTGQCSVHRGQVMRAQGAWPEALDELERAVDRYRQAHVPAAAGLAESERGDILRLRGEYDAAAAAYQRAGEHGHDPQPGLALLWLARGATEAAAAAVRRLLAEPADPAHRARLLPAAVEVLLGVGAVEEARTTAEELDRVAAQVGSTAVLAMAAHASGAVEVAAGDPAGALPYLRKARQLWARVECPYDGARVRWLTGRALAALGDTASAQAELEASVATFRQLGAAPALEEVERLLHPTDLPAGLTAREVEVLRLVAVGRSNAAIATELVLSEKTVARHLSNIFGKLGVGSRTAAAAFAYERGLV